MRTDVGRPVAELAALDLRLRRRQLLWTGLGAAGYLLLVVAVYPSFRHDTSLNSMIESNPTAAAAFGLSGSITSPAGWLGGNMYANVGPLLTLVLTIGYGASSLAGANADGSLGLIASLPVGRPRLGLQKLVTLLAVSLVVPAACLVACLPAARFDLHPNWAALVAVSGALAVLGFDAGALALLGGAWTGSRGVALAAASAFAAVSYLVGSLAATVRPVHAIRGLSPFYWSVGDGQLSRGVSGTDWTMLVGLGLVLAAAAVIGLRRLDID